MSFTDSANHWFMLLTLAAGALVMMYLVRRMMRGMSQQDWILLRQARASGIDLTRPQPVDFVVFAATEETANELADKMRGDGFDTRVKVAQIQYARNKNKPTKPQDGWLITGTRVIDVMPETLTGTRQTLTQIAVERKALYLGWQIGGRTAQDAQPTA